MRFTLATVAMSACALAACSKAPQKTAAPVAAVASPMSAMPSKEAAFAVAYPTPKVAVMFNGEAVHLRFSPVGVYRVDPETFVLVSAGENLDGDCHVCAGAISIAYLGYYPALAREGEPVVFPSGGWGQPGHVRLGPAINSSPVLLVETGDSDQGITQDNVTLVRLGPTPREAEIVGEVPLNYDNTASGFGPSCTIRAKLLARVKDIAFSVEYSGSVQKTVSYQWTGGEWRADAPFTPESYCADQSSTSVASNSPPTTQIATTSGQMGVPEVDRLTTDAVLLGRAIGCHLDVDDETRRVGEWLDRAAPPGSKEQQIYLPMLMAGMHQNAEAQAAGRSPDTCAAVASAVRHHSWP